MPHRDITSIAAGVGLFAGADSFTHIYDLARFLHESALSAALLPLAGDGMVVVTSRAMSIAARQGVPVPGKVRAGFWLGIAATIAANAASGLAGGPGAAILSLWAVASYLVCVETLVLVRQRLVPHLKPAAPPGAPEIPEPDAPEIPDADAPEVPEPDAPVASNSDAPDDLRPRRERRRHQQLTAMLKAAEAEFPEASVPGARIPALRDIQKALKTGQPYAQQVQAHFRRCQAGARSVVLVA